MKFCGRAAVRSTPTVFLPLPLLCYKRNAWTRFETGLPADYEGEGNRLVISEFKKHTIPRVLALDMPSVSYTFRRRVVWDLEQSQLIAA